MYVIADQIHTYKLLSYVFYLNISIQYFVLRNPHGTFTESRIPSNVFNQLEQN